MTQLPIGWLPAEPPLQPCAVAAVGESALRLLAWLAVRENLGGLQGVAGADAVVVLGDAAALPWVDGVVYLGRHPQAPSVLWPTTQMPDLPVELVDRAFCARVAETDLPVAVLPDAGVLVPLAAARPLDIASIRRALASR